MHASYKPCSCRLKLIEASFRVTHDNECAEKKVGESTAVISMITKHFTFLQMKREVLFKSVVPQKAHFLFKKEDLGNSKKKLLCASFLIVNWCSTKKELRTWRKSWMILRNEAFVHSNCPCSPWLPFQKWMEQGIKRNCSAVFLAAAKNEVLQIYSILTREYANMEFLEVKVSSIFKPNCWTDDADLNESSKHVTPIKS